MCPGGKVEFSSDSGDGPRALWIEAIAGRSGRIQGARSSGGQRQDGKCLLRVDRRSLDPTPATPRKPLYLLGHEALGRLARRM
jgi:hypothetical protein